MPENTNAYQFMQVENRSVRQPTSPSVDSEIHPDIIQGALLFLFSIHKETESQRDYHVGFPRLLLWAEIVSPQIHTL